MNGYGRAALFLAAAFLLGSCIGGEIRLDIRGNGSAEADMEFRVAKDFAGLGAPAGVGAIPLDEEDVKNAIRGKDGVKLKSYRRTEDEKDYIYKIKLSFASTEALVSYLDSADSGGAAYRERDGAKELAFYYWRALPVKTAPRPETFALLRRALDGYTFGVRVTLPSAYTARFAEKSGAPLPGAPSGTVGRSKKSFAVSAPVSALFREGEPAAFILRW